MTTALETSRTSTVRTADGAQLHVVWDGDPDAKVTVLLSHGWTLNHRSWAGVTAQLVADGYRVLRYDQRAHGGSTTGTRRSYSIELLAEDLSQIIEELVPTGPVLLGGHSMGGMTTLALAAARPELFGTGPSARIRGVALVSTSAGRMDPTQPGFPPRTRLYGKARARVLRFAGRHADSIERSRKLAPPHQRPHQAIARRGLFGPHASREVVRDCAEQIHTCPMRVITDYFEPLMRHNKRGDFESLRQVPVRILAGSVDRLTPVRHSKTIRALLPEARLHVEPDCGHMLLMERPDLAASALRQVDAHTTAAETGADAAPA